MIKINKYLIQYKSLFAPVERFLSLVGYIMYNVYCILPQHPCLHRNVF